MGDRPRARAWLAARGAPLRRGIPVRHYDAHVRLHGGLGSVVVGSSLDLDVAEGRERPFAWRSPTGLPHANVGTIQGNIGAEFPSVEPYLQPIMTCTPFERLSTAMLASHTLAWITRQRPRSPGLVERTCASVKSPLPSANPMKGISMDTGSM